LQRWQKSSPFGCCRLAVAAHPAWTAHPSVRILYHSIAPLRFAEEINVKWAGMYLVGFIILLGGLLAALWKMGVLARIGVAWTLIGIAIAIGLGIMIAVTHSGNKENIEIDRK
jgi:hypothetical protein